MSLMLSVIMFLLLDILLDFAFEICRRHCIRSKCNHNTLLTDDLSICKGCQDCKPNRHRINEVCVPYDNICADCEARYSEVHLPALARGVFLDGAVGAC